MNRPIISGNSNSIIILSVLLIILIILLFALFFMYLRYKRITSEKMARLSGKLDKTYVNFNIFMTNLSREIRSHMISVMGNDEIILRDSVDNSIKDYALRIRSSSEDVLSLTQGVNDFMRIGSGNLDSIKAEYDLASFIIDISTTVSPGLKNREILLNVSADRNCPRNLIGDPAKNKSVLVNLFSFIAKNMESKGSVDVAIGYEKKTEELYDICYKIICKGLTTDSEKIKSCILLSPADNRFNFSKSDLGFLELFLSGAILNFLKSKLLFEEMPGGIKEFTFSLPATLRDSDIVGDIRDVGNENIIRRKGGTRRLIVYGAKVLLIDDNKDNVSFIRNVLESVGALVFASNDVEEAEDFLRREEFDILYIREGIADNKNVEFIKRVRGGQINPLNCHKPCVALCYDEMPDKSDDSHLKYDDFIAVPASSSQIEDVLIKYLPENKVQKTNDYGVYPQIHGIEDIRKYSEGYEDLFRNALNIYKRASNFRDMDKK